MKFVATALTLGCLAGCFPAFQTEHDESLEIYHEANDRFIAGQYRRAIPLYQEVLRMRPRIAEAYVRIADCRRHLGDDEGALAALETGVEVCGSNRVVALPLAQEYERQGRVEKAKEIYRIVDRELMKN